ncbi:conserved Plasmodium protein, unknown function [Plasmodium malariae]|uniref:Uncharacterized protein n=1 Tax=Plasmodium malariae TaxID=5858 RepID=A0A1C3KEM4_PLAMA|nr:conserved Plasmodium protein, unknown function [Plasmodium malariae]
MKAISTARNNVNTQKWPYKILEKEINNKINNILNLIIFDTSKNVSGEHTQDYLKYINRNVCKLNSKKEDIPSDAVENEVVNAEENTLANEVAIADGGSNNRNIQQLKWKYYNNISVGVLKEYIKTVHRSKSNLGLTYATNGKWNKLLDPYEDKANPEKVKKEKMIKQDETFNEARYARLSKNLTNKNVCSKKRKLHKCEEEKDMEKKVEREVEKEKESGEYMLNGEYDSVLKNANLNEVKYLWLKHAVVIFKLLIDCNLKVDIKRKLSLSRAVLCFLKNKNIHVNTDLYLSYCYLLSKINMIDKELVIIMYSHVQNDFKHLSMLNKFYLFSCIHNFNFLSKKFQKIRTYLHSHFYSLVKGEYLSRIGDNIQTSRELVSGQVEWVGFQEEEKIRHSYEEEHKQIGKNTKVYPTTIKALSARKRLSPTQKENFMFLNNYLFHIYEILFKNKNYISHLDRTLFKFVINNEMMKCNKVEAKVFKSIVKLCDRDLINFIFNKIIDNIESYDNLEIYNMLTYFSKNENEYLSHFLHILNEKKKNFENMNIKHVIYLYVYINRILKRYFKKRKGKSLTTARWNHMQELVNSISDKLNKKNGSTRIAMSFLRASSKLGKECKKECTEECKKECTEECKKECTEECKKECTEECKKECTEECKKECTEECKKECTEECKKECTEECKVELCTSYVNNLKKENEMCFLYELEARTEEDMTVTGEECVELMKKLNEIFLYILTQKIIYLNVNNIITLLYNTCPIFNENQIIFVNKLFMQLFEENRLVLNFLHIYSALFRNFLFYYHTNVGLRKVESCQIHTGDTKIDMSVYSNKVDKIFKYIKKHYYINYENMCDVSKYTIVLNVYVNLVLDLLMYYIYKRGAQGYTQGDAIKNAEEHAKEDSLRDAQGDEKEDASCDMYQRKMASFIIHIFTHLQFITYNNGQDSSIPMNKLQLFFNYSQDIVKKLSTYVDALAYPLCFMEERGEPLSLTGENVNVGKNGHNNGRKKLRNGGHAMDRNINNVTDDPGEVSTLFKNSFLHDDMYIDVTIPHCCFSKNEPNMGHVQICKNLKTNSYSMLINDKSNNIITTNSEEMSRNDNMGKCLPNDMRQHVSNRNMKDMSSNVCNFVHIIEYISYICSYIYFKTNAKDNTHIKENMMYIYLSLQKYNKMNNYLVNNIFKILKNSHSKELSQNAIFIIALDYIREYKNVNSITIKIFRYLKKNKFNVVINKGEYLSIPSNSPK